MPKRKILFLITKATMGGAQKYVYDIATQLPRSQFDVIVAYGTRGKLAKDLLSAAIKLRELPSLARNIALFSDIKSFVEILRALRELRPDVLHLNSSKAAALGSLAARLTGVPKIIFTVHGWPFKEDRNILARALIYVFSWGTALFAHSVIVVSKTDEEIAKRMWGIKKRVRFIPLGIAPFALAKPQEGYRAMFGALLPAKIGGGTLRLVSVGELTRNKGLRYGIEAVRVLTERGIDSVYVIAGEGEERAELIALAKKSGVDDRVFFPGFVENPARNLSGFDVFVLPSLKEGTPYVLLEAARSGIPIVATDVVDAHLAQTVPNVQIVSVKDSEALCEAIMRASKIPRAQDRREDLFLLSRMLEETTRLYG